MRHVIRALIRYISPASAAVLDAVDAIPEAALRRWLDRHFATVEPLARAALQQRGLKP